MAWLPVVVGSGAEETPRRRWTRSVRADGLGRLYSTNCGGLRHASRDPSMYRAFLIWLGYDPEAVPEFLSLKEFSEMWDTTVERWKRELREEWREEERQQGLEEGRLLGREEGRKDGEKKGVKKGEAQILLRLLERKFGPLDRPTRDRVNRASSDRLLVWSDRILTAERLEQVFEG